MQLSSKTQTWDPKSTTRHNILMHRKYIIHIYSILSNIIFYFPPVKGGLWGVLRSKFLYVYKTPSHSPLTGGGTFKILISLSHTSSSPRQPSPL